MMTFYKEDKYILKPEDDYYYKNYIEMSKEDLAQKAISYYNGYLRNRNFGFVMIILFLLLLIFLVWYNLYMRHNLSNALEGLGEICNAYIKTI